jgi:hypothetical protein
MAKIDMCRCRGARRWVKAKLTGDGGAGRVGGGARDGVCNLKKGGDVAT